MTVRGGKERARRVDGAAADGVPAARADVDDEEERDREQRPKHAPTLKKYRGVYQGSINAWYSQISIAGQPIHLGSFAAPEDAARAYDRAIWSKLGTAAASLLNFPDDIPESLPYLKEQLKEQEAAKAAEAAKASTPA